MGIKSKKKSVLATAEGKLECYFCNGCKIKPTFITSDEAIYCSHGNFYIYANKHYKEGGQGLIDPPGVYVIKKLNKEE